MAKCYNCGSHIDENAYICPSCKEDTPRGEQLKLNSKIGAYGGMGVGAVLGYLSAGVLGGWGGIAVFVGCTIVGSAWAHSKNMNLRKN